MKYIAFLIACAFVVTLSAQSTVDSIPNQKLIDGSYVSNPDGVLDNVTVEQIDTLLGSLEKNTTVQVAVVVVASIGDADIFEFAQELFTSWGIGNKDKDNGLLLLLVIDQRTVRFHTGSGMEGVLPDAVCKRIQRAYMVPEFRNGNYNAGVLAGLQQVERIVTDPAYAEELKAEEPNEVSDWIGFVIFLTVFPGIGALVIFIVKSSYKQFSDSKLPSYTDYPEMRITRWNWFLLFVGIPALIVLLFGIGPIADPTRAVILTLYLYYMFTLFYRLWRMRMVINRFLKTEAYPDIVEFIRKQQWYWLLMAVLFPPFLIYFFYHLTRKRSYRNRPRLCKICQGRMEKLDENTEDAYLSAGMQMEETLKSVDYDIWRCTNCQSTEMFHYLNRRTKYESCPKCKTIAFASAGKRTIRPATYSTRGEGEETRSCKFCGHSVKSKYYIARLEKSSGSSGGGSGSSGSSSSSGGGSWGGGSSGGGGASSSW